MWRPEVRLPVELAALREIRWRASRYCAQPGPEPDPARLAELRQALAQLEKLEQDAAAHQRYELLPPPNVHDRGE